MRFKLARMGNFSSCAMSSCSSRRMMKSINPPSPPSSDPMSSAAPSAVAARVLLLDGGALTFTAPIKVISLLLDYPFHVICPVDSLRPGQHSLSSLLPDEELELGQLYLLLPLKTFENRHSMPNMEPLIRNYCGKRAMNITQHFNPAFTHSQLSMRSVGILQPASTRGDHPRNQKLEYSCGESARLLSGQKSDVGSSHLDDLRQNLYVGGSTSTDLGGFHRHFDVGDSVLSREKLRKSKLTSVASFSSAGFHSFRESRPQAAAGSSNLSSIKAQEGCSANYCSRLCDTPALQMAYRSVVLRRCRSWTPRLQPITENKLAKSVTSLD